jgi:hypothetical protein
MEESEFSYRHLERGLKGTLFMKNEEPFKHLRISSSD